MSPGLQTYIKTRVSLNTLSSTPRQAKRVLGGSVVAVRVVQRAETSRGLAAKQSPGRITPEGVLGGTGASPVA